MMNNRRKDDAALIRHHLPAHPGDGWAKRQHLYRLTRTDKVPMTWREIGHAC